MGRIVHAAPARPGGAAHWAKVAAAVLAAAAVGAGLTRLGADADAPPAITVPAAAPAVAAAAVAEPALVATTAAAPAVAERAAATCPIQSLQLSIDRAPLRTVCMDTTLVRQSGSVRSYVVRAGDAEGWNLRIDMVERAVYAVVLEARDGRAYGCDAGDCAGSAAVVSQPAGAGHLDLRDLRLVRTGSAAGGDVVVSGRLRVPSDEQVPGLACTGPSATLTAANGSLRRFCGQGGAGVEIADDGQRHYRFQDHEGRTLLVSVDTSQRIAAVDWEGLSCRGSACRGASTSSADPSDAAAERSFFFGRTALFEPGAAAGPGAAPRPALILDGTLVMPGT